MRARGSTRRSARVAAGGAVALALVLGQTTAAQAHGGRHDSSESFDDQRIVELTTPGSRGKAGLALHQTQATSVTATNAAVAYTACDGCRAVALSFQVVIADGGPTDLDVGNLALAMNENCTGCESVAVAFQLVLASDRKLVLSNDGRRELNDLRRQLKALARSDLPVAEIQSTAESMMSDVANVLATQLRVRAKVRCDHDMERRPERAHLDRHAPKQTESAPVSHGHRKA
ncbi:MAG: hypothetical protein ABIO48_10630 [Pedococcus sp.]